MKSMGKAMTQLGELTNFNDEMFDEQSHAQLGTVDVKMPGVMSEYFLLPEKHCHWMNICCWITNLWCTLCATPHMWTTFGDRAKRWY
jgi:hypothetical protein